MVNLTIEKIIKIAIGVAVLAIVSIGIYSFITKYVIPGFG